MMNSPQLWDKLLQAAPKGSALMGGAIIDYLLGIPVKDYDIFYTYHPGIGHITPNNWELTKAARIGGDWKFNGFEPEVKQKVPLFKWVNAEGY